MKHIFENAIDSVNTAYPSIYTKEDVVKLIQAIQARVETFSAEKLPVMDLEALEAIKEKLLDSIGRIAFEDCVELELGYNNHIEISVNERMIVDEIRVNLDEAINEVYPTGL
jgi:hypothetical protein